MPHSMKHFFPFFLFLCSLVLTSCIEGGSDTTPVINVGYFITSSGDTLGVHYDSDGSFYYFDSVNVGDTIQTRVLYQSFTNFLVWTDVKWDTTQLSVKSRFEPSYINATSVADTTALYFEYKSGYNAAGMPLQIVPLVHRDCKLSFSMESDAKRVENTRTETFYFYVR